MGVNRTCAEWAVVIVAGAVLGGCAGPADAPASAPSTPGVAAQSGTGEPVPGDVPLPLWTGVDISSANLVMGELTEDDRGCLGWTRPDGGFQALVWPDVYRGTRVAGRVVVLDPDGEVVAREGEMLHSNGGFATDLPAGFAQCAGTPAAVLGPHVAPGTEPVAPST